MTIWSRDLDVQKESKVKMFYGCSVDFPVDIRCLLLDVSISSIHITYVLM